MWVQFKIQCTVCRNCRCLYVQVLEFVQQKDQGKQFQKKFNMTQIYCVLSLCFVNEDWKILVNSVFITSGYWEYFSDAEKVLYLFYVRVVHHAGICTCVPLIQFYEENDKS